jgi:hypothetical protein
MELLKKTRISILIFVSFVLAEAAPPALARLQTESYTENYGSASAPLVVADLGQTGFPVNLSLPQFNPSLGTLEDIVLTLSSTDIVGYEVLNETGSSQPFSHAYANITVTVSGLDSLRTTARINAGPFAGALSPGANVHAGSTIRATGDSTENVPSGGFGLYTGSGLVYFDLSANAMCGRYGGSAAAGVFFGGFAECYGTIGVQYCYEAVPEPGNVCAGFAALGFCLLKLTRLTR